MTINKERAAREGTPIKTRILSNEMVGKALRVAPKHKQWVEVIGKEGEEYVRVINGAYGPSEVIGVVPQGKCRVQIGGGWDGYFFGTILRRGRSDQELAADIAKWHQKVETRRAETKSAAKEVRLAREKNAQEKTMIKSLVSLLFGTTTVRRARVAKLERAVSYAESGFRVSINIRKANLKHELIHHEYGAYLPREAYEDD
jgi:hypothetical protein